MSSSSSSSSVTYATPIQPFEWLTSPASLEPHLLAALDAAKASSSSLTSSCVDAKDRRVLHIGCGSSVLAEVLLERHQFGVKEVVNVDNDGDTLRGMQKRWEQKHASSRQQLLQRDGDDGILRFLQVDLSHEKIPVLDNHSFDLVVDKSTLDCLLCSETAVVGLLGEVHRLLKVSGVYLVISFHPVKFLRSLLENVPGTNWEIISETVMLRQVEDLIGTNGCFEGATSCAGGERSAASTPLDVIDDHFQRRTVNVLQCRQRRNQQLACTDELLDRGAVCRHILRVCDWWFRCHQPMVTETRKQHIADGFEGQSHSLPESYQIVFTDTERELLDYDDFLEDWRAFCQKHPDLPLDTMSADTALAFLEDVQ
jgi:SAM-dependent methyltransferase